MEVERRDGSQRACVERMCRELINARTLMEILSDMNDVNQDQEAVSGAQLSRWMLEQIIRPGKEGGTLTHTEFVFSKFCGEEKLKKKHLIVSCL